MLKETAMPVPYRADAGRLRWAQRATTPGGDADV
ncbi:hypothetical protein RCH08_004700 [Janthinobacterium sp. CG_S6]|nr:hypothetical protein [Janthinobacterium sp. CG_S6]